MGQDFIKKIRPAGCVLFIALAVFTTVLCFTVGADPIKGYEPPHTDEYYAQHLEELRQELEENVFPHIEGVVSSRVGDGVLVVELHTDRFASARAALLHYYGEELFELVRTE